MPPGNIVKNRQDQAIAAGFQAGLPVPGGESTSGVEPEGEEEDSKTFIRQDATFIRTR